jgi:TetR/AcrR family tetracycline transcriptional repressor
MAVDKSSIVRAAFELVDEAGLAALSTRRLAARLGISSPSLYWHFRSKQELIDHMAEALLASALPSPNLTGVSFDWRSWLAEGARSMRRAALSRRDGGLILMASQPAHAHYAEGLAVMTKTLQRSGLSPSDARATLMCLGRFAIGWAAQETQAGGRPDAEAFEFGVSIFIEGLSQHLLRPPSRRKPSAARARSR